MLTVVKMIFKFRYSRRKARTPCLSRLSNELLEMVWKGFIDCPLGGYTRVYDIEYPEPMYASDQSIRPPYCS